MLRDSAPHDRLEIGDVRDVDDLIDALHERGHRVVRREALAEQDNEMLAPQGPARRTISRRIGFSPRFDPLKFS